jgi:uncharacterized protein (TIGR02147 family)
MRPKAEVIIMKVMKTALPKVTDYLDYRSFLKDFFLKQKEIHPGFSVRSFARHPSLMLTSSGFMTQLLQGKRNLSQQLRLKFVQALHLDSRESEYFDFLVQFNQAKSLEEKNYFFAHLSRQRGSRARLLLENQNSFFSQWYNTVIWNYFGLPGARRHAPQISKQLVGGVSPEQVEQAMSLLQEMGLITKTANGFSVTDRHLVTPKVFSGQVAKAYHKEFMRLGADALDTLPPEQRQFNVLTFSVSDKGFAAVKQRIEAFLHEVREIIDRDEDLNQVNVLALQLFPAAKIT